MTRSKPFSSTRRLVAGAPVVATLGGLAGALLPGWARAAGWPTKPIKSIVPFATGGTTDIVMRLMAPEMTRILGQNILVENRGGAGGTIGAMAVKQAAADGYTIGVATVSTTGTAPNVYQNLQYDPVRDFTPIIKMVNVPGVIAVHPSFPARNYAEFIKVLKASPGKYNYASSGAGGVGHMGMELFKLRAGVFMTHIAYRGAGPALNDVVAGQVPIIWDNLSSSLPFIKAGKLVAIGLANAERIPQLPDLATFAELGLKDYDATTWFGLHGPAGMPADAVAKINAAANEVLKMKPIADRLIEAGAFPVGGSADVLRDQIAGEIVKWAEVAKFANVKL